MNSETLDKITHVITNAASRAAEQSHGALRQYLDGLRIDDPLALSHYAAMFEETLMLSAIEAALVQLRSEFLIQKDGICA